MICRDFFSFLHIYHFRKYFDNGKYLLRPALFQEKKTFVFFFPAGRPANCKMGDFRDYDRKYLYNSTKYSINSGAALNQFSREFFSKILIIINNKYKLN